MEVNMLKSYNYFIIFICFFINYNSEAATINATSCSQANVQAAVNSANEGDTVIIPAGSCTWTTGIAINNKALTLSGSGKGVTKLTDGTTTNDPMISIVSVEGKPVRIKDITFQALHSPAAIKIRGTTKTWRVDHCEFLVTTGSYREIGVEADTPTYGVIDNCYFFNVGNHHVGDAGISTGDTLWQQPLSLGTANAMFIEDCEFVVTLGNQKNIMDSNNGSRYVFRHNTVHNGRIEAHSECYNGKRGTFSVEAYDNTFTSDLASGLWNFTAFSLRGGTAVVYNNALYGKWTYKTIFIDNTRTCDSGVCTGQWLNDTCDGTGPYDGNLPGGNGYPCRDQIGRSTDTGRSGTQSLEPMYEWNNTYYDSSNNPTNTNFQVNPSYTCANHALHIQANRDYYNDKSRPGYTPYQYPHPLRVPGSPPKAPSLFIITTPTTVP